MNRKLSFVYSGYCPTQQDEETIEVYTVEFPIAGRNSPGYKKTGLYCDYANSRQCEIANDCPIYLEAPDNPYFT